MAGGSGFEGSGFKNYSWEWEDRGFSGGWGGSTRGGEVILGVALWEGGYLGVLQGLFGDLGVEVGEGSGMKAVLGGVFWGPHGDEGCLIATEARGVCRRGFPHL